jgi:hypothetical protein
MPMPAKPYTKEFELARWSSIEPGKPILPHFYPVPYKAEGSRYGACGIRIDGSPAFIDAVLSRLKDLIDGENAITRLDFSRRKVDGRGIGKDLPNSAAGAEVAYIRLQERGREAQYMSVYDRRLVEATERAFA